MNLLSLIPFGLRSSDQQYVDVSDVESGLNCKCICPSCKTPLIARKGEVMVWHFAHASKNVSEETKEKCKYSFWVSIILMAKQVIATADIITLPELNMYTNNDDIVKVTKRGKIEIDSVEMEKKLESISADAVMSVGNFSICILFDAPHRDIESKYTITENLNNIAILRISLKDAVPWLSEKDTKGKYSEILRNHILSDDNCKSWIHHPRKQYIEQKHNIELHENPYIILTETKSAYIPDDDTKSEEDSLLWEQALELTKIDFRDNKQIDPEMDGWAGWVKGEADKLFKKMKKSS